MCLGICVIKFDLVDKLKRICGSVNKVHILSVIGPCSESWLFGIPQHNLISSIPYDKVNLVTLHPAGSCVISTNPKQVVLLVLKGK